MKRIYSDFTSFAWLVLAYNLVVVGFGAFVRATGSGAGCGSHWPLCNGEIIPRAPQIATLIEYTHRLTSGLTLVLILILVFRAFRRYPHRHPVRWGAALALLFTVVEALIGAWLVLAGLVAANDSLARAVSMMAHLANTYLLLGALALTAWWSANDAGRMWWSRGPAAWLIGLAALGTLFISASGAVAALGDTLFPAATLLEGLRQDLSPAKHYLIRLRVLHPFIAFGVGLYLTGVALWIRKQGGSARVRRMAGALLALFFMQLTIGVLNVALLAPVPLQIVHLLVSTLIWVSLILLGAAVQEDAALLRPMFPVPAGNERRLPHIGKEEGGLS